jgi:hypothetical protein
MVMTFDKTLPNRLVPLKKEAVLSSWFHPVYLREAECWRYVSYFDLVTLNLLHLVGVALGNATMASVVRELERLFEQHAKCYHFTLLIVNTSIEEKKSMIFSFNEGLLDTQLSKLDMNSSLSS